MIGNNECDAVNNFIQCGFDGGDCCDQSLIGNGKCDDFNNFPICENYDGGDCRPPNITEWPNCPHNPEFIGDETCQNHLKIAECNFDAGDCCDTSLIGNKKCDAINLFSTCGTHQEAEIDCSLFTIKSKLNQKALEAHVNESVTKVRMWTFNGSSNQLWYWDDDYLRNKMFPQMVLSLGEGNLAILEDLDKKNSKQKWTLLQEEQFVTNYNKWVLDLHGKNRANGAVVGGYGNHKSINQKWTLEFTGMITHFKFTYIPKKHLGTNFMHF